MAKKAKVQRFVVVSGLDYGRPGWRLWMWKAMVKTCVWFNAEFVVIQGRLVASKFLLGNLPKGGGKAHRDAYDQLVTKTARELADILPVLKNARGAQIKYYLFTSPAISYDGEFGAKVARQLSKIRHDVKYWDQSSGRLPLWDMPKWDDLAIVLPNKAVFAPGGIGNDSSRPERFVNEYRARAVKSPPALFSSDCGGTSVIRPAGGNNPEDWNSVPLLHSPDETITVENQVGIRIVERIKGRREFTYYTLNLKDFAMTERDNIRMPKGLNPVQIKIFDALKEYGTRTVGMLEDATGVLRSTIKRHIDAYTKSGFKPGIEFDETGGTYAFNREWLQKTLVVDIPNPFELPEDRVVAYCCLHAGSSYSEYDFFIERSIRLILEKDARYFVSCGDNIQGLKHNQEGRGEVLAGFPTYTSHQRLSALIAAKVVNGVFDTRFEQEIAKSSKKPALDKLVEILNYCLVYYKFRTGNHDTWDEDNRQEPLAYFQKELTERVYNHVQHTLLDRGLILIGLEDLIADHVVQTDKFTLSTGLAVQTYHPYKGSNNTTSSRGQEILRDSSAPVNFFGNFHKSSFVQRWNATTGQQDAVEVTTLCWQTLFERRIIKKNNVGVVYYGVRPLNGRIFVSEIKFVSDGISHPERTPDKTEYAFYEELKLL